MLQANGQPRRRGALTKAGNAEREGASAEESAFVDDGFGAGARKTLGGPLWAGKRFCTKTLALFCVFVIE